VAIDQLDYRRAVLRAADLKVTQDVLSASLGISQPALSKMLRAADRTPQPRAGFTGADPYEIAQRYAVGELTRAQVLDELSRWDYAPGADRMDGYDSLVVSVPGSFDDVSRAYDEGLLDQDLYEEILVAASGVAGR